jgi:hypothetical protein
MGWCVCVCVCVCVRVKEVLTLGTTVQVCVVHRLLWHNLQIVAIAVHLN